MYIQYREQAKAMINAIQPQPGPDDEIAGVTIQWKLSALGERLWAAGHICGSREYAVGFDPFKSWGRKLRYIAVPYVDSVMTSVTQPLTLQRAYSL